MRMYARIICVSAFAITGAALTGGAASAQSAVADRCRAFETEAERFACMEGALAAAAAELEAARSRPAPAAPAAQAPAPSARVYYEEDARDRDRGDLFGLDIPFIGGGNDRSAASGPEPVGLGSEQVVRRMPADQRPPEDNDRVRASIVSFRERIPGQFEFNLDNGQVWRQLQGDTFDVRLNEGDPMLVEMWRSWAGGYRLRLVEQDQLVRVERIR